MAAISRVQLLHHPSAIFSRLPHLPSSFTINLRRRKFSCTSPLLCSSSSSSSTDQSIVGDILDYLNESWTQFHATGLPNIINLPPSLSFIFFKYLNILILICNFNLYFSWLLLIAFQSPTKYTFTVH